MGVCINQKLGQYKKNVKATLDLAQRHAEQVKETKDIDLKIEVRRLSDFELLIDIKGCETLAFVFKSVKEIEERAKKEGFSYSYAVLTNDGAKKLDEGYKISDFPDNEKYYSADFTKTQYAGNILAHKLVADIIKVVALRCFYAEVSDEGNYYHTGELGDAIGAIRENGKMIDAIGAELSAKGFENIIKGGETKIGK
jgi:hypothetical protein|tara:strand:+ start:112 stop:702 length:591 start_codon:yes stop_codon:yes gene_type:complete